MNCFCEQNGLAFFLKKVSNVFKLMDVLKNWRSDCIVLIHALYICFSYNTELRQQVLQLVKQ